MARNFKIWHRDVLQKQKQIRKQQVKNTSQNLHEEKMDASEYKHRLT